MQFIDQNIENYAVGKSTKPSDVCQQLADFTKKNTELPQMLTGPMEMSFLGFLIKSLGVVNILEVGTFTGYSALAMAENLPSNGTVTTLDIDNETAAIAEKFWNKSEHGKQITQIIGPALESMSKLNKKFDLVFIDADKVNYLNYLKRSLELISDKGVIVVDNALWSGKVLNPEQGDESSNAINELNEYVANNPKLYSTLLPIRDGIHLIKCLP